MWLIGQYIQKSLYSKDGTAVCSIKELAVDYPSLELGELINKHRELFGVNFDWDSSTCVVRYRNKEFDITDEIYTIVVNNLDKEWINNIGFDTKGFDINNAFSEANRTIIDTITEKGEL